MTKLYKLMYTRDGRPLGILKGSEVALTFNFDASDPIRENDAVSIRDRLNKNELQRQKVY